MDSVESLESLKILCFKNVYFRFYGFVAICIKNGLLRSLRSLAKTR